MGKVTDRSPEEDGGGELIFHSGFEGTCAITADDGRDSDIVGIDNKLAKPNDWEKDLEGHPNIGFFYIFYEAGDNNQRFAKIISEPGNPENKVLHFWLGDVSVNKPPIVPKGRITGDLLGLSNVKQLYQSIRVFIHPDFEVYKTFPHVNNWMTILEFWNNRVNKTEPYGFRISVNMVKTERQPVRDVYFEVHGQIGITQADGRVDYTNAWEEANKTVPVPIGKWFTLDYYLKEGNAGSGRFYMTITPDQECTKVIFDVNNYTHHPQDPNPKGIDDANIMKWYTRAPVIEHFKAQGKALQVYWDDLKLWIDKAPQMPKILLEAESAEQSIKLKWSTTGSNQQWSGFEIVMNGNVVEKVNSGDTEFSIKNLAPGNTYRLQVNAIDNCGNILASNEVIQALGESANPPTLIQPRKIFSRSRDTVWTIEGIDECSECIVTVFSRSGAKIFESANYRNSPWDGTLKGAALAEGPYSFIIKQNNKKIKSGTVTIIK